MKLYKKISVISLSLFINIIFLLLLLLMKIAPSLNPLLPYENSFFYDVTEPDTNESPSDKKDRDVRKPDIEWVTTERQGDTSSAVIASESVPAPSSDSETQPLVRDSLLHDHQDHPEQDSENEHETVQEVIEEIPELQDMQEEPIIFHKEQRVSPRVKRGETPRKPVPLTLAQLAQGFLNKQGALPASQAPQSSYGLMTGNAPVTALGAKTGVVTAQQMRIMNYFRKVEDAFINEMTINNRQYAALMKRYPKNIYYVQLYFSLTHDGKISMLQVGQSCGFKEIDEYIVSVFQQASSSFPPVPSSMADDPLTFGYKIGLSPVYASP